MSSLSLERERKFERWHWSYESRKVKRSGFASVQDWLDAFIKGVEEVH